MSISSLQSFGGVVEFAQMKDREQDFKDYAWELCRQKNFPGCVSLVEMAMKVGYEMALKDSTELCGEALETLKKLRERSNAPQ